jgi:hypothetical protein
MGVTAIFRSLRAFLLYYLRSLLTAFVGMTLAVAEAVFSKGFFGTTTKCIPHTIRLESRKGSSAGFFIKYYLQTLLGMKNPYFKPLNVLGMILPYLHKRPTTPNAFRLRRPDYGSAPRLGFFYFPRDGGHFSSGLHLLWLCHLLKLEATVQVHSNRARGVLCLIFTWSEQASNAASQLLRMITGTLRAVMVMVMGLPTSACE